MPAKRPPKPADWLGPVKIQGPPERCTKPVLLEWLERMNKDWARLNKKDRALYKKIYNRAKNRRHHAEHKDEEEYSKKKKESGAVSICSLCDIYRYILLMNMVLFRANI